MVNPIFKLGVLAKLKYVLLINAAELPFDCETRSQTWLLEYAETNPIPVLLLGSKYTMAVPNAPRDTLVSISPMYGKSS